MIDAYFPPDLSPAYLRALLVPVAQTIGMASAGMLVAFALGVPLAVLIGTRAPGHRFIVGALSSLRAIPDLTLAILAVVVVGLGPAAGIVALLCDLAHERRIALLCSLHQPELARRYFDRVVELVGGRVRSDSRTERASLVRRGYAG